MVESSAVENIRERIRRKFAVYSHSIIHMSMMGTQSTYFDSALVLWYNTNDSESKSRNQWLNKVIKMFKFSTNMRNNKKVNNLE